MTCVERPDGWRRAVEFVVKSDIRGDLYEFGCFSGSSLSHFWRAAVEFERQFGVRSIDRFFAFDSFQGMPQPEAEDYLEGYDYALGTLRPGSFASTLDQTRETLQSVDMDLTRFVPIQGFYSESLFRADTAEAVEGSICAVLHIDCDFESSAFDALQFMTSRLQDGCVLLFDDWFLFRGRPDKGVQQAFKRWLPTSGYTVSSYFTYSWAGAAFILHRAV